MGDGVLRQRVYLIPPLIQCIENNSEIVTILSLFVGFKRVNVALFINLSLIIYTPYVAPTGISLLYKTCKNPQSKQIAKNSNK